MEIAKERPAYISFELRAEEDRQATIDAGHYVPKEVEYVIITPQGSKDRTERVVKDWFDKLAQDVKEGRFPSEWLTAYRAAYAEWKAGNELPLQGSPIREWPVASPGQVASCIAANIRTVEDLAVANEESIGRLGMGGRALKQKAIEWLATSASVGKTTEQITALKVANEALKTRNAELEARLSKLEAQAEAGKKS